MFNKYRSEKFVNDKPLDVDWDLLWSEMVYPNNGNTNQVIEGMI